MRRHHIRSFASRLILVCAMVALTVSPGFSQTAVAIATVTLLNAATDAGCSVSRTAGNERTPEFRVINGTQTAMRQMQIGLKYSF